MLDDPLILKTMPLCDLIKTQECVASTVKYARKVRKDTPILIVQGSKDHCVVPDAIVKLAKNMRSGDQTMKWLDQTGHLLLETHYLKAGTIAAINDWIEDHQPAHLIELKAIEADIRSLGGEISQ
jgi:alpha-beta hydrolase superfamily lysophospholipase